MDTDTLFTDWEVYPLKAKAGNLLANGKVTIAGTVKISFTIVEGQKGLFASLPSKKSGKTGDNGKEIYYPDVKILDPDTYAQFQTQAVEEYENRLASGAPETTPAKSTSNGKKIPF